MTKNNRGEASCLPSILLGVAAPAASDLGSPGRDHSDRSCMLHCCFVCAASRPPPRFRIDVSQDESPILSIPTLGSDNRGFSPPSGGEARNRGAVSRPRPRCLHRGNPRRHPERVGGLVRGRRGGPSGGSSSRRLNHACYCRDRIEESEDSIELGVGAGAIWVRCWPASRSICKSGGTRQRQNHHERHCRDHTACVPSHPYLLGPWGQLQDLWD